ncbi:hypothetical protein BURK1_02479 [Burkholderiales bacterium]|nr:hypothetical protein BURK1_02479 [Burkholderiales bacterium]
MNSASAAPAPYELLGGDAGVRALVDALYDRMDLEEAFAGVRALHHASLDGARDKLHKTVAHDYFPASTASFE